MLRVLIVDDEPLAHEVLLHHCRCHGGIEIAGQCHNAAEALAALDDPSIDLMFLDIRLPRFDGIDLLRGLESPPLTVIVSAYREHALDGYDLDVVDYLLKPVSQERFATAVDKARRRLAGSIAQPEPLQEDIVLKVDRSLRRFSLDDIDGFEAQGNFVLVLAGATQCLATTTLTQLVAALPADKFARVHKSHVINCGRVAELRRSSIVLETGKEVPVGKTYRDTVRKRFARER